MEVIITSEISGQSWNSCIWDLSTGGSLQTYKGGSSAAHTLCLLNHDYILSAVTNKSAINVWSLRKQDQVQMKMVTTGNVRAMTLSPCGQYCVAAIMEKIHVWQVCTGELFATVSNHYQNVNVLVFSQDGSYLVSGGDDGLVVAYSLPRMIAGDQQKGAIHTWNHHSLPVTGLHICDTEARAVSSSLDHTCKMYDLVTGSLLCTFVLTTGVTSLTLDNMAWRLFTGLSTGDIVIVNLYSKPLVQERHITETDSQDQNAICKGHKKQVTCLSVSMDGNTLVSGSHDWTVKIWHVASCQCTRTLNHKGAITNAFITTIPRSVLEHQSSRPTQPIQPFKRFLTQPLKPGNESKIEPVRVFISKVHKINDDETTSSHVTSQYIPLLTPEEPFNTRKEIEKRNGACEFTQQKTVANDDMKRLYEANKELYKMALDNVLANTANS